MWVKSAKEPAPNDLVRRLLLDYLQAYSALRWPGGDGMTEDDALSCYSHASRVGEVPDRGELCRRHSELREEIESFFFSSKHSAANSP